MKPSKRSASAAGISRKKNDGALSGSAAMNWRRRLPSISITVTSSARPRPSDSTKLGVKAPGRWILAMASRNTVERGLGTRRAIHMISMATKRSARKHDGGGGDKNRRDAAVIGEQDRERRERRDNQRGRHDVAPLRPAPFGGEQIAEQRRDGNVVRARQRPQREGERGEEAVDDRQRKRARMQRRRDGQRNDRSQMPRRSGTARWRRAPRR